MTREEAIEVLKDCELNPCVPKDKEAVNMALKALEQKPKMGHWIGRKEVKPGVWKDFTVFVNSKGYTVDDCRCSECGDWLTGSDEYDCPARYCPNCGAKMEVKE